MAKPLYLYPVPLAAEGEGLHDGNLRRLSRLVDKHCLEPVLHALEDAASCGGERREHHVSLVHEGQLQIVTCLRGPRTGTSQHRKAYSGEEILIYKKY